MLLGGVADLCLVRLRFGNWLSPSREEAISPTGTSSLMSWCVSLAMRQRVSPNATTIIKVDLGDMTRDMKDKREDRRSGILAAALCPPADFAIPYSHIHQLPGRQLFLLDRPRGLLCLSFEFRPAIGAETSRPSSSPASNHSFFSFPPLPVTTPHSWPRELRNQQPTFVPPSTRSSPTSQRL